MPLPLKDRKIASIEYIIKKLKGSDSYDKMKEHNEGGHSAEVMLQREGDESDYGIAYKEAANEMLGAFERKDAEALQKSLKAFISMCLDENETDESMMKQTEIEHLKRES